MRYTTFEVIEDTDWDRKETGYRVTYPDMTEEMIFGCVNAEEALDVAVNSWEARNIQ